ISANNAKKVKAANYYGQLGFPDRSLNEDWRVDSRRELEETALELEKAENEEITHRLERVGFLRHREEECLRSTRSGTVRWAKAGMERRQIVHLGRGFIWYWCRSRRRKSAELKHSDRRNRWKR
ncbi:MAG: hypothetical protein Q9228_005093, partial [Teloschistes exilis]